MGDGYDAYQIRSKIERLVRDAVPAMALGARDAPLLSLGLGSLAATRLLFDLEAQLGVIVPIEVIGAASLDGLVAYVAGDGVPIPGSTVEVPREPATRPAPAGQPFPLLPLQEWYVMARQPEATSDPAGCHIYREFQVDGLDLDAFRAGWRRLVAHHDALRTVVTPDGRQAVLTDPGPLEMPVNVVADADYPAAVERARVRLSWQSYEAEGWPHLAVEATVALGGAATMHVSIDGLIVDGHSLTMLLEQWSELYRNPGQVLPVAGTTLQACVERLTEPVPAANVDFWVDRLAGAPDGPFVQDAPERDSQDPATRRPIEGGLAATSWAALKRRAERIGVSPTTLVFTAFCEVLAETENRPEASFVLTTSERPRLPAAASLLVGPFTSSMVVSVEQSSDESFDEACGRVHRHLWEGLGHRALPGVTAMRALVARSARAPALPVVFTSLLGAGPSGGSFALKPSYALSQTATVAIDHQMWEVEGRLGIRWDVADDLLPWGSADWAFASLTNRLRGLALDDGSEERPLNELQMAYFVARSGGEPRADSSGCQAYFSFALSRFSLERLVAAWSAMVSAYPALRSTVTNDGKLRVLPAAPPTAIAIANIEAGAGDGALEVLRDAMTGRPFRLGRWPMFDLRVTVGADRPPTVHLAIDLAIADGRSLHLMVRELFRIYGDPSAAPAVPRPALPPAPPGASEASHAYWRAQVVALPPGPALAPCQDRTRTRYQHRAQGWLALRGRPEQWGMRPDAILLAALATSLGPFFEGAFTIPVVRFRHHEDEHRPAELSAMSWVVANQGTGPLFELAGRFNAQIEADEAHAATSGLAEFRRHVMRRRQFAPFDTPIVYTSVFDLTEHPLGAGVTGVGWMTNTPDVALDCISVVEGDELHMIWDAVETAFAPGVLDRAFHVYCRAVESALVDDALGEHRAGSPPGPLSPARLSPAERRKILFDWNDTAVEYPAAGPVHLRFEEAAARSPTAVALRWRGGTMTFAELNEQADSIAAALSAGGATLERTVAICLPRGPGMIAAVFGILKCGGTYVPIEPTQPLVRARRILELAECSAIVTESGLGHWVLPPGIRRIDIDRAESWTAGPGGMPAHAAASVDSAAYVIFTSGSTGEPKGVVVAHRAVHNLLHWCQRTYGFGPEDTGLCVTSLAFDLSVFDILGLLGYGAALYIADEEEQRDPALLLNVLVRERITFWNSAPTTLDHLRPLFHDVRGGPGLDDLRLVFLSGDYTPLSLPADLCSTFSNAKLVCLGGATEATVWSNYFPVDEVNPEWRSIPYGRPIDNARYYVLDEAHQPCPPGEQGDLFIAGDCLSAGYCNQPELTAQQFVPDPFVDRPGERMYRTGDRATFFPDGNISFEGRADHQVKVRGFRVELGEVEHALRQHAAVRDVVVLAREDKFGDRTLVAYLLADADGPTIDTSELRPFASHLLPPYMVPSQYAVLDAFPATSNGKLDRASLPWPVPAGEPEASPRVAAAPELEETLEAELLVMLGEMLGHDIDPGGDLWDQGVTSFNMVRVSGALRARHGQRIPVAVLAADPTVRGIARAVAGRLGPASEPAASAGDSVRAEAASRDARSTGDRESPEVELLSPDQRDAFKAAARNRPALPDGRAWVALGAREVDPAHYLWRSTQRQFASRPVSFEHLAGLLALLGERTVDGRIRRLYPSAGETYAVQVYLVAHQGGVAGLDDGAYWFDPSANRLVLVTPAPGIDRSVHFVYNRPVFDQAHFSIYLVGELAAIEPLYGADAEHFLHLEAGYIGELLMFGQAASGIGLCPVGTVADGRVGAGLGLGPTQRILHSFLGGEVDYVPGTRTGPPLLGHGDDSGDRADQSAVRNDEELAIVGMAGRYPGADDLGAFWQLLRRGQSAFGPPPRERAWQANARPTAHGIVGGFLERTDEFDSFLFGVAPVEARTLDPQVRLLLHGVWECLERSGHDPASLQARAGPVGVFAGVMWHDYQHVGVEQWRRSGVAQVSSTGSDLANRLSHVFGFKGPSVAVDTSCSSSLTALHLAAESLRRHECAAAVVCGVNLISHPYHLALLQDLDLLASEAGHGAFDATGSGWSPGEGVGALLLRRMDDAVASGDRVLAVVEGTTVGHCGGSSRYGSPDAAALEVSLRSVLAKSGLRPADIDYVECAAAGASIADAAEVEALSALFQGCAVPAGTLKPNIGHLEAAAGVSQLTKAVLQLEHRQVAPTILARDHSGLAALEDSPIRIADRVAPLGPGKDVARVLVNGMGATGSFAHAVLRSAPPEAGEAADERRPAGPLAALLSAQSDEQLRTMSAALARALRECPELKPPDVAFTLQTGRRHLSHRLAVPIEDPALAVAILERHARGLSDPLLRVGIADPARRHGEERTEGDAAVSAWLAGANVAWADHWLRPARRVVLPTYPFSSDRLWVDDDLHDSRHGRHGGRHDDLHDGRNGQPDGGHDGLHDGRYEGRDDGLHDGQPDGGHDGLHDGRYEGLHDGRYEVGGPGPDLPSDDEVHTIEGWLREAYSGASGVPIGRLDRLVPLEDYGVNSKIALAVSRRMEERLGTGVPATLLYEHETIADAAAALTARHQRQELGGSAVPALAGGATNAFPRPRTAGAFIAPVAAPRTGAETGGETTAGPGRGDIAIIGLAGRYPDAPDVPSFWRLLATGTDAVRRIPPQRCGDGWPTEIMWGGWLDGVDQFDPLFFGITPADAALMAPEERLFLEVVWEALEDAGQPPSQLRARYDSEVAVFAGAMHNEYPYFGVEASQGGERVDSGATPAGIANRVSYHLGLHGPSMTVDSMCSSSLSAVHLAVEALRSRRVPVAIAGGVNLSLHPNKFVQLERLHMSSHDHRCRSLGAGGDGFVPGEGVGAVVLKLLAQAEADGDRIDAVIRGTWVNHGGKTNGYTVPSPDAQGALIRAALADAGVDARSVGYVEAHGTGTELGDPIELVGLAAAFGPCPAASVPIGSVKSNIGHLEAAAGIAALTKVVLQLRHRTIVPSLHATEPNPLVAWNEVPFRIQTSTTPWEPRFDASGRQTRRAAISSFGAGGSNAHLVVEGYEAVRSPGVAPGNAGRQWGRSHLLVLSARTDAALRQHARRLAVALEAGSPGRQGGAVSTDDLLVEVGRLTEAGVSGAELLSRLTEVCAPGGPSAARWLGDIAYTLQVGREAMRQRLAFVADTISEAAARLERFAASDDRDMLTGRVERSVDPTGPQELSPPLPTPAGRQALLDLGARWVEGAEVDFEALHSLPRPALVSLPAYPFSRVTCWLAPRVAAPARRWELHCKNWAPAPPPLAMRAEGRLAVLADEATAALAQEVATRLEAERVVLAAPAFQPSYEDLFPSNGGVGGPAGGGHPLGLIDLTALGAHDDNPWLGRVALLQSLAAAGAQRGLRVVQAVSGLQDLGGPAPSLRGARLAGFVRLLGAELPRSRGTVVDLDSDWPRLGGAQLAQEYLAVDGLVEVCYRGGTRLRPTLVAAPPATATAAVRQDRCYVVTGGLRGLGEEVASDLVRQGARRIAIVGRPPADGRAADVAGPMAALESAGAAVRVHLGGLADKSALGSFLSAVRAELGPIAGVVHCAGQGSSGVTPFSQRDLASMASTFEPKVEGLQVLASLCETDDLDFFVLFSSIAAVVPPLGAGIADYAAANAFMDLFAGFQRRRGRRAFRSVTWPVWLGAGRGEGGLAACRRVGLDGLEVAEGLEALWEAVAHPASSSLVPVKPWGPGPAWTDLLGEAPRPAPGAGVVRGVGEIGALGPGETGGVGEGAGAASPGEIGALGPGETGGVGEGAAAAGTSARRPARSLPAWLLAVFSSQLGTAVAELDHEATFEEMGVGSVMLAELVTRIEVCLGRPLEPTVLLEHPTLERLAAHLEAAGSIAPDDPPGAADEIVDRQTPREPEGQGRFPRSGWRRDDQRVAVLGLGCRFPGAADAESFWANLVAGVCSVTEVPPSRWDLSRLYAPVPARGKSISKWGGFIDGIEDFDAAYFGIGEPEAILLDPAIRLYLEAVEGCLGDAGYERREVSGREVGVFAGARMSGYRLRAGVRGHGEGLGLDQNFIAARVAHHLDLHGPNLVVDAACSSALVAVHLACQSLVSGESELAVAGGVDVLLDEEPYLAFSAAGALSSEGRCLTFDRRADGFVPGEGVGALLLKRLDRARADGDSIRAVIDATAVNNDGHTMGITTPNPASQSAVVRRALSLSGRRARDLGMIEAHGTATAIGDPIELRALTQVFREDTSDIGFCSIGSVKSNVGHLLSAAGVAGLVKAILAVERGIIPATLFCDTPNPRFDFASSPFVVASSSRPWPGEPRVAGVSAFGLGGTNAHVVVSDAVSATTPQPVAARRRRPPPHFHRRRLWLERGETKAVAVPAGADVVARAESTLFDIEFESGDPQLVTSTGEGFAHE